MCVCDVTETLLNLETNASMLKRFFQENTVRNRFCCARGLSTRRVILNISNSDLLSVANLAILLLNLATFQTTLSNFFLLKAASNKFSYFLKFIWQLLISDSSNKKACIFHLNYTKRANQRNLAVHTDLWCPSGFYSCPDFIHALYAADRFYFQEI